MKQGNSLKCIVFVMYQVASFQQMVAQRYLYDHQRKIMFCYFARVPVTCGFPCMHCWSRQEMLQQLFFFNKDLWERLVGISTKSLQYKASTAECRVHYRDHMATWISKRTGATMARILCYDFGNASCTHSTKLVLVLILQFDIVISRFHLSALLWKPMHGLKISPANITAWEKKTEYHDVSAGWEIHRWMRLQAAWMGFWNCSK